MCEEGDRRSEEDGVADWSGEDVWEGESRAVVNRGERDYDEVHEEVDAFALDHARGDGVVDQEANEAGGDPVDSGGSERDNEVEEESEEARAPAHLERAWAEGTAGDGLQDSERWNVHQESPSQKGLGDVECAAGKSAESDGAGWAGGMAHLDQRVGTEV